MKTYQPVWNFQNRLLYLAAAVSWLLFLMATLFVAHIAASALLKQPSRDSALFLAFPLCMIVGLGVWTFGMFDSLTRRFELSITEGKVHWRHAGGLMERDFHFDAATVTEVQLNGRPDIGMWVTVETHVRTHRLGHLLSLKDAREIASLILAEKESAFLTTDGQR